MSEYFSKHVSVLRDVLAGNSLAELLMAAVVGVAVWGTLWVVRNLFAARDARVGSSARSTPLKVLAHLLGNTRQFFFLAVAVDAAQELLTLPERVQYFLRHGVLILILLQVGLWAGRAIRFYLQRKEHERGADQAFAGSLDIINFVMQMLIWSLLILVALDNLGVNITALLAGLGVGGVAVALALQNVLGDLFASLSIALDKPFVVGDGLSIDTFVGKVEHIGIKTTRLRSESGEQIVLSNADMLKSRIRNFGRLTEQRVLVNLRLSFDASTAKLEALPGVLERVVRENAQVRFERCHLKTLGDTAFIYELSYFVLMPAALMDLQQLINLRIVAELRTLELEFAYPTQVVLVDRVPRHPVRA